MPETLLSPSTVLLYGRVLLDLQFAYHDPRPGAGTNPATGALGAPPIRESANDFLEDQLRHAVAGQLPGFARIYGFSFEGYYYDLAKPAIFLVHGPGDDPDPRLQAGAAPPFANPDRASTAPHDVDFTGTANQDYSFASDLRVWPYDKGDFSIRLDTETGPFEQILLEAELDEEAIEAFYSGQRARVGGQRARVGGQRARVGGQRARMRDRGGD